MVPILMALGSLTMIGLVSSGGLFERDKLDDSLVSETCSTRELAPCVLIPSRGITRTTGFSFGLGGGWA